MATVPVGNLVDQFSTLSSYWNSNYGGATVSGGYARVPCTHTGGTPNYAGFLSTRPAIGDTWTMSSTALHVEVVTRPVGGGAGVCYCQLAILSSTSGTYLSVLYDAVGGNLSFGSYTGFSDAGLVVIPHIPSLHRWWRIRHSTGRIYWETSPDGTTWTVRRTLIGAPSWITTDAVSVQLDASRNGGTNDYAEFDNVNVTSYNTTVSPSAVSAIAAVPALSTQFGSTMSPLTVPTVATVQAPTISAGSTVIPGIVSATASVSAPTMSAGSTATPGTVPVVAAVPVAGLLFDSTMSPSAVAGSAIVHVPSLLFGSTMTPARVSAVAAVPSPSVQAGTTVSPGLVAVAASVPIPTIVVSATMLAAPPGITFVRYPLAQFVSTQLAMPLCGGSATTLSLSGSVLPVTLSGSAVIV